LTVVYYLASCDGLPFPFPACTGRDPTVRELATGALRTGRPELITRGLSQVGLFVAANPAANPEVLSRPT